MKISEAIAELQSIKELHGDIRLVAHDGLSPSDLNEVTCLSVGVNLFFDSTEGAVLSYKAVEVIA